MWQDQIRRDEDGRVVTDDREATKSPPEGSGWKPDEDRPESRTDAADTADRTDEPETQPAERDATSTDTAVAEPEGTTARDETRTETPVTDHAETAPAGPEEPRSTDGEAAPAGPADSPAEAETDQAETLPAEEEVPVAAEGGTTSGLPTTAEEEPLQLFQPDAVERFRAEWLQIQAGFVDDPRDAVRLADQLVAEVIQSLSSAFNEHKSALEAQWQQESTTQTEDLRLALRRYRSLLNQLLST